MKDIGDQSERIACQWLRDQGYQVTHIGHQKGPIDIIATRGNETLLLDVKTNQGTLSPRQRELGVLLLLVDRPSGRCRIVTRRRPLARQFQGLRYGRKHRIDKINPLASTT
jgi:Holliday junction resolvase